MWKPRGYEASEWNNATVIMIDQARQIGNLKARIEKLKKRSASDIKELEGDKYASEIPCYWVWDESRQEYTTSCLFGVTYADCDYCPKCGRKVDKCVKPTGGISNETQAQMEVGRMLVVYAMRNC